MSASLGKILFIVLPLLVSLSWFAFWVVKLLRLAKRAKGREQRPPARPTDSGPPGNLP